MAFLNRRLVAIVPARGGSKGVLKKNLRRLGKDTLVEITLKAALGAPEIDQVILSSDSSEILDLGQKMGVACIHRPPDISNDLALATDVVKHTITHFYSNFSNDDIYVIYLQPTSPLRTSKHISEALRALAESGTHSLVAVKKLIDSPYKAFSINSEGKLTALFDESLSNQPRQGLPQTYIPNGAIYVFRASDFLKLNGFPNNGSYRT